jgi:putative acetyltransferase
MFEIRPIRPEETWPAKQLIYTVARDIFNDPRPLAESMAYYESRGELRDMDDIQANYFDNGGIFLVMTDNGALIGTGALRRLEGDICELKRLWFLTAYHGRGLGYRMIETLLDMARARGYKKIRLETDPHAQSRAMELYLRLGFYEIPRYSKNADETAMEMVL